VQSFFSHETINFEILRSLAFNKRWAEVEEGVIPLTAADSDFPAPPELLEELKKFISAGYFPYVPNRGYPEVRRSIAEKLNERKNEGVVPELLLPVDSAARGMYIIAQAILDPGDEAVIFDPVDFLFTRSVETAGAKPILFPARLKDNHIDLSDLESYITPKTRMLGLCNPHNPLGVLYTEEDLTLILELADKYNFFIMNDEIWSDIVFQPNDYLSILSIDTAMRDKILSVYGFSKSFGIAGLRAGCIYTHNRKIFERLVDVSHVETTAGGVSILSQIAARICMEKCFYWNEAFVQKMRENRDYALSRIASMPGIHCHKPDATFLLFPDITGTGLSSEELADYLRDRHKLALVPGTPRFFGPGGKGHVRICLSTSLEVLTAAMDRLEAGLMELSKRGTCL
jgi:aspartate/methionine/tyrosine aminotransferase